MSKDVSQGVWNNHRSVGFVRGYHAASELPIQARDLGFTNRFAIILDTHRPDIGEAVFDSSIYVGVMESVFRLLSIDRLTTWPDEEIESAPSAKGLEMTPEAFIQLFANSNDGDAKPPYRILGSHHGTPGMVVHTEGWVFGGGPWPYHDSYTFSVFTPVDCSQEFRKYLWASAEAVGARVRLYIEASEQPHDAVGNRKWNILNAVWRI